MQFSAGPGKTVCKTVQFPAGPGKTVIIILIHKFSIALFPAE